VGVLKSPFPISPTKREDWFSDQPDAGYIPSMIIGTPYHMLWSLFH